MMCLSEWEGVKCDEWKVFKCDECGRYVKYDECHVF